MGCKVVKISLRMGLVSNKHAIGIHETKSRVVDDFWIKDIWGGKGYGYFQLPGVGNSRGIVLVWDSRIFISKEVIGDKRFIAVKGDSKGKDEEVFLVCIYGPHVNVKETIELNDFANDMRLVEIMMWGRKFTRVSDDGVMFSKLDRFLLNDVDLDFGPKPFRVFNDRIKKISMKDAGWLETPFNEKEVLDEIRGCSGDKAQGADGFNFKFIQKCFIIVALELSKGANSLQAEDHNLWDVIVNGDLEEEPAPTGDQSGPSAPPAPKTAKQLAARRNQKRVKSILLLAIPDEYLLKFYNFENFSTASNESLDKAYDRFQKLISQLEVHGAPISKEYINQKFLRSPPSSWNQIALIMRNKPDIDKTDIGDLYNNLRVYEDELKRSSGSNSASQNLAFLSSENTSSTNEVSTANGDFGSQLKKRFSVMEEMTWRNFIFDWQLAKLLQRFEWLQLSRKGQLCKNAASEGYQERRCYGDNGRSNAPTNESSSHALVAQDGLGGYDWSNDFEVEPVNYALMAISSLILSSSSDSEVVKERDELKDKIAKWEESTKNLDEILNSQMSARDKTGLGYSTQLNELSSNHETDSENSLSIFDVRSSDEENTPENDRFLKNRNKIIESQTTELNTKTSETACQTNAEKPKSASDSVVSNPKINRNRVITEDWNSISRKKSMKCKQLDLRLKQPSVSTARPVCTARSSVSTARPVCTARPSVSNARPVCIVRSSVSTARPICTARPSVSTARPVCTARPSVSTARPVCTARPSVSTARLFVLEPKGNYWITVLKTWNIHAQEGWSNLEILLQDYAVVDSGYSSHMTGNKAYHSDYEDFNRGFVLFESSSGKDKGPTQEYILFPLQPYKTSIPIEDVAPAAHEKPSESSPKDNDVQDSEDVANKESEQDLQDELEKMVTQELATKAMDDVSRQAFEVQKRIIASQKKVAQATSTNKLSTDRPSVSTDRPSVSTDRPSVSTNMPFVSTDRSNTPYVMMEYSMKLMMMMKMWVQWLISTTWITPLFSNKREDSKSFFSTTSLEEPKTISQALQDESWVKAMQRNCFCSNYKRFEYLLICHMEKVIGTKWVFRNKKDERSIVVKNKAWLVATRFRTEEDDIIFGSTKKSMCTEFEDCMHKRFQMSSMGELTFFLGLQVKQQPDGIFISQDKYVADILKKFDFWSIKTATTPIESNKPLVKDEYGKDVDVHVYRSMISSLMYLTASRPDIMFAFCLWYPRDLPFELEAFLDSDYRGASLNKKSTTGGYQFLGRRLISWQCKKQTIMANSTTKAEYVAAANCCGKVLWIQNQMLDYGFNFMNTKIHIDNESTISVIKNLVAHSRTKHIEIRFHFISDCYEKRLIEVIKFTLIIMMQAFSPNYLGSRESLEKDMDDAIVDGKPVISLGINKESDLLFDDAVGIDSLE
ncbi:putative ribonuclease H-like domain-containing protein [Tanacetum coccineum]|uniref:Ribonuclease H-like domain-containing protein n=1 Tax=Tanacetum coccineum TaxID=301880 RepID=A0ABQ5C7Y8_9ASTR